MSEKTVATTITEWKEHWLAYYDLSGDAECLSPDHNMAHEDGGSPGARLLDSVRSNVIDAVEYAEPTDVYDLDRLDDGGALHEIADGAPDPYTHTRWSEFVDLGGYQEDLSELGEVDPDDLTRSVAGVALYLIAHRLIYAMIADLRVRFEDMEDDDDADDDADAVTA